MIGYNWTNEITSPGGACNTARRNTQEVEAPMCSSDHTPIPRPRQAFSPETRARMSESAKRRIAFRLEAQP